MEVRDDRVIILSQSCEAASEIDVTRAEAAKVSAEKLLSEADSDEDLERAQQEFERAMNRLSVAKK